VISPKPARSPERAGFFCASLRLVNATLRSHRFILECCDSSQLFKSGDKSPHSKEQIRVAPSQKISTIDSQLSITNSQLLSLNFQLQAAHFDILPPRLATT